jgi:hypothetical protein
VNIVTETEEHNSFLETHGRDGFTAFLFFIASGTAGYIIMNYLQLLVP